MSNAAIREQYEDRPSTLRYLYESGARQQLADYFLGMAGYWDEDSEPLTKQDIIDATGMQRRSIIAHIDVLVELGVVNKVEGKRWDTYEPAVDKDTYHALISTNNILGEHYEEYMDEQQDN